MSLGRAERSAEKRVLRRHTAGCRSANAGSHGGMKTPGRGEGRGPIMVLVKVRLYVTEKGFSCTPRSAGALRRVPAQLLLCMGLR